ncbi:MFS transporter [Clostridium felsineum]|uniref:Enterobactin exporter EntS n=1 Tax=Clostridium felsineum TaxID=36839 RepID=A0A1S8LZ00_9CLOT|nr:MFS transporter [Clostridium felsineum]URZ09117.1 Enterobactin exporter EntS [Clostridium felsineum]URZ13804.1 Enterobactin exporter EntS [Clostridium felsineum]
MKKNKNLISYLLGRLISLLGSGIQTVALPLYILDATGSGTLMGVFSVFTFLPAIIASTFSGIVGDRKNRKNVMIAMDLGRGIMICFLAMLATYKVFNIYILFIMQVFISIMDNMFNSSSSAILPELIDKNELIEANSSKGGLDAIANILGPALGGIVYGIWGIKMVFYINAASFLLSALSSLFIKYKKKMIKKEKINAKIFFKENYEVIEFIKERKGLLQLCSLAMLSNFFLSPMFDIVVPYALKRGIHFSSQHYGYIVGAYTVGILLGNLAISAYFKRFSLKWLMKFGLILESSIGIISCLFFYPQIVSRFNGSSFILFISIAASFIIEGFSNAFVNTPIMTNMQNLVPDKMLSRFFSFLYIFTQSAIPIGAILYGVLLDRMKYFYILTLGNILAALIAIIFLTKACDEAYEAKENSVNF